MLSAAQKEDIARRLDNWARWNPSGGGGNGSPYPAYRSYLGGAIGKSDGGVPVLVGEAHDTDALLRRMHPALVKPLLEQHLRRGTPSQKAKRCGILIRTFQRRVTQAEAVFHGLIYSEKRRNGAMVSKSACAVTFFE